jgi:hypothetical protein
MDESPFSCLLEDDGPITNIDIKTAHRLEPAAQDPDEVVFLLRARTGATDVVVGNLAFLKCWRKRRTLASSRPYLLPRKSGPRRGRRSFPTVRQRSALDHPEDVVGVHYQVILPLYLHLGARILP